MFHRLFILVTIFSLLSICCSADLELDEKTFQETLEKNPQSFIKFYSPYCGYCQKFAPAWSDVQAAFEGALLIGSVDVTKHTELAKAQGVQSVPSIKWYQGTRNAFDYTGARARPDIINWILTKLDMKSFVYGTPEWTKYAMVDSPLPIRLVYAYTASEKPTAIESLFKKLKHRAIFATLEIPDASLEQFKKEYSVTEIPALVSVKNNVFHTFSRDGLERSVEEYTTLVHNKNAPAMADPADAHSNFTVIFFFVALIGIGIFAFRAFTKRGVKESQQKTV